MRRSCRDQWVHDELVEAGRARSQSLSWPDAYAFTKALGERQLVTNHPLVPTTVVRPSIIESALSEPRPGWIRGFRMAEPIIISYARGLLRDFPGIPEGVVDIIPVDLVVSAILAIAAAGPDPGGPSVYHVTSGVANPLRYVQLQELVQSWFTSHPLYDSHGQPIVVPDWSFPGHGRVQRQLQRATGVLSFLERLLGSLPVRGERAEFAARVEERRSEAERALSYVELYGAYAETEARFRVDHLSELWDRLSPEDRVKFCFDPAVIDWEFYVSDVHLPSIVEHARVRTSPKRSTTPSRSERSKRAILSPERHLAAFDLENTLVASNVVESYAWLAGRHLPIADRASLSARILREAPRLLALDRRDRGDFLRSFYRRYEGAPAALLREDSVELFHHLLLRKSFPAGIARGTCTPGAGTPHRPHNRCARLRGGASSPPLRRGRLRGPRSRRGRPFHGTARAAPPDRRGACPVPGRVRRQRRPRSLRVCRVRRLGLGPTTARMRWLPGRGQPGSPPGSHRAQTGLAHRAVGQGSWWGTAPSPPGAPGPRGVPLVGPSRRRARRHRRRPEPGRRENHLSSGNQDAPVRHGRHPRHRHGQPGTVPFRETQVT